MAKKKPLKRKTKSANFAEKKLKSKSRTHEEAALRLRRASGHLEKVIKMVETGSNVTDILQQLSAVVAALSGCRVLLFNGHIKAKLRSSLRGGNEPLIDEIEKLASRILRVN